MGMNLIGYLVKGPRILDRGVQPRLVERTSEMLKALVAHNESEGKILPSIFEKYLDEEDLFISQLSEIVLDLIEPINIDQLIEDFYCFWNEGSRDSAFKVDPDDPTQELVFAGEPSYGDDQPDGEGYNQINRAYHLGWFPILGIR